MQLAAFTNWWHLWGEIVFLAGDCAVIILVLVLSKMREKTVWWWLIPMIASTCLVIPDLVKKSEAIPSLVILSFIGSIATLVLFFLYLILRKQGESQNYGYNPDLETIPAAEDNIEPTVSEGFEEEVEEEKTRIVKHLTPTFGWFVGMNGKIKGKRFDLNDKVTSIGRGAKNDVVVDDESVSKEHAKVKYIKSKDLYKLYDLVSTNGTFLNGNQVEVPVEMHDGDEVELGEAILIFKQIKKRKPTKEKVETKTEDTEQKTEDD